MQKTVNPKDIRPSETNPRKSFPKGPQEELEKSIKASGILQPILVRPIKSDRGDRYECVTGERRLRASMTLKLDQIPVLIRSMTDEEVQEVQQIENLQRLDLSPMEEARGFAALSQDLKMSTADIAAKVGKDTAFVLHRIRLTSLDPQIQKMVETGELTLAVAYEFTRIPDRAVQIEAFNALAWEAKRGEAQTIRRHIENRFVLNLKRAPFKTDDAALCPKAGACLNCPKRSGAQTALFAGSEKTDLCLDGKCFQSKVTANNERLIKKYKDQGRTILTGPDAVKAMNDLQDLESHNYPLRQGVTFRAAFKDLDGFTPIIALDEKGRLHHLVDAKKWMNMVKKEHLEKHSAAFDERKAGGAMEPERMGEKEKSDRKKKIRGNKIIKALYPLITQAINEKAHFGTETTKAMAKTLGLMADYSVQRNVVKRLGQEFKTLATTGKETPKEAAVIIFQILAGFGVRDDCSPKIQFYEGFEILAPALGIDLKKLQKQAEDLVDAPKAKEAKKEKK